MTSVDCLDYYRGRVIINTKPSSLAIGGLLAQAPIFLGTLLWGVPIFFKTTLLPKKMSRQNPEPMITWLRVTITMMSDIALQISYLMMGFTTLTLLIGVTIRVRRVLKKIHHIESQLNTNFLILSHENERNQDKLKDIYIELKTLNLRTSIVETRLEERHKMLDVGSSPSSPGKRGRPRKVVED